MCKPMKILPWQNDRAIASGFAVTGRQRSETDRGGMGALLVAYFLIPNSQAVPARS
jgi:hypothetical protein